MGPILIILSSAVCNPELQFMFGPIPASAVPVGGTTLLNLQLHEAEKHQKWERIFVTYPESEAPPHLPVTKSPVEILPIVEHFSLVSAIECALAHTFQLLHKNPGTVDTDVQVHLTWGDTLICHFPTTPGFASVVPKLGDSHHWFTFTDGTAFAGHITGPIGDLNDAVQAADDIQTVITELRRQGWGLNEFMPRSWFDFGHMSTYFHSKRDFLTDTTRHFNDITLDGRAIVKTSKTKVGKIAAEANWFRELPTSLRSYVPAFLSEGPFVDNYRLEYLPQPSLAELYVYGRLTIDQWKGILKELFTFLRAANTAYEKLGLDYQSVLSTSLPLYTTKVNTRLNQFEDDGVISLTLMHTLKVHASMLKSRIVTFDEDRFLRRNVPTIVHGDLCFSNILYDQRMNSIKLIDPRGLNGQDVPSILGDVLYELAKIYHSLIGYDHAVAGVPFTPDRELLRHFENECWDNFQIDSAEVRAATSLLFLSMLPLHSDSLDRQLRFIDLSFFD